MKRRVWSLALVVVGLLLAVPASSSAASWTCRGSAAKLNLLGATLAEPVIANNPADPCQDDDAGQSSLSFPLLGLSTQEVYATTRLLPAEGTPNDVATPTAAAGVAGLQLSSSGVSISVNGADSNVSATCVSGAPRFTSNSHVAQVTINGTPITLDSPLQQLTQQISGALGEIIDIRLNESVSSPTALTRNAVHIIVLSALGTPLLEVWAGVSQVSANGPVCTAVPPNCPVGTHVSPDGTQCDPDPPNCPPGTHFDQPSNTCIQDASNCPPGTHLDAATSTCVQDAPNCPPGTHLDAATSTCVQDAPNCPPGTHLDAATSTCVQDAPNCPPGTHLDQATSTCVQNPPDCPTGSIFDPTTMHCVAGPPNCPAGTVFSGPASACVPTAASCPTGAHFDPAHLVCVVGGQPCPPGTVFVASYGVCVLVATVPTGAQVVGGTVITLAQARQRFKSPCLSGPGPNVVVIGTPGRDDITGTNGPDRILSLGDNDSVDGGRGNDCIDGGIGDDILSGGIGDDRLYGQTGADTLSGGLGNDRLFGMSGNDHLVGGSGADRDSGGSGNDSINANFGADIVKGGSGRDHINVATAGPSAHVDCGSGKDDKVRINQDELKFLRGCEHIQVLRTLKGHR